jgi:hypothetical protein
MAEKELDEGEVLDISLHDFADVVESQSALIDEIMTSTAPEAEFLRSMFSDGFLEEKQAETKAYVADLRKRAEEK